MDMALTRRSFLVHCGTLIAGAALGSRAGQAHADSSSSTASDSIDVIGYANRMSVRPGDEIAFKIDSQGMPYYSEMVRLQYAWDTLISLPADELRLQPAQIQPPIPFGSYMHVEGNTALVKGIKAHAELGGFARCGIEVMRLAARFGQEADLPVYIHFGQLWPVPETGAKNVDADDILPQVVELLKPGDVLAHPFTRHPGGFVDKSGRVHPIVREALARGLW